jgi:hypothetical protein
MGALNMVSTWATARWDTAYWDGSDIPPTIPDPPSGGGVTVVLASSFLMLTHRRKT